jgi:hypothetical protein
MGELGVFNLVGHFDKLSDRLNLTGSGTEMKRLNDSTIHRRKALRDRVIR